MILRALLILVFCLPLAAAGEEAVTPDRPSETFELDFTATAWFPRLTGTFAIGPDGTTLDVETDTFLHGSEVAFNGEADLRMGAWTFHVAGSEFSTSGGGVLEEGIRVAGVDLAAGSLWASSYDQWTIEAEADLALWRPFADEPYPWSSEGDRATNRNQDGDYLVDVRRRIARAQTRAGKLRHIWAAPQLTLQLKLRLYISACVSILTYGSEAWLLDPRVTSALRGANARMLARITKKEIKDEARDSTTTFNIIAWIRATRLK